MIRKKNTAVLALCAALVVQEQSWAAQVQSTWLGNVGNWSDVTQWSSNPLDPVNDANNTFAVSIGGGTVTLDINTTVDSLNMSGGQLISNSGALKIASGGSFSWTGGSITTPGLGIYIPASASGIFSTSSGSPTIFNSGTLTKTGSGNLTFNGYINNTGSLSASAGSLFIANSKIGGTAAAATGALIEFDSNITAGSSLLVSGSGTVRLNGNTSWSSVNVSGNAELGAGAISGAHISYGGSLTVLPAANPILGAGLLGGLVTLDSGGKLVLQEGDPGTSITSSLNNNGDITIDYRGGRQNFGFNLATNAGTITLNSTGGAIVSGTLKNTGTMSAAAGTLQLDPFTGAPLQTFSGTLGVASGATIDFHNGGAGGAEILSGSTTGAGRITVSLGTVRASSETNSAAMDVSGGTLEVDGTLTCNSPGSLTLNSGSITGAGTISLGQSAPLVFAQSGANTAGSLKVSGSGNVTFGNSSNQSVSLSSLTMSSPGIVSKVSAGTTTLTALTLGTVGISVQQGNLNASASTTTFGSSSISVAENSSLNLSCFSGTTNGAVVTFAGAGLTTLAVGSWNLGSPIVSGNLALGAGANVTATSMTIASGGSVSLPAGTAAGTITVSPGAALSAGTAVASSLNVANNGAITLSGPDGSTWAPVTITATPSSSPTPSIIKIGSGTTTLETLMNCSSAVGVTISAAAGTLHILTTGTWSGGISPASGATITVNSSFKTAGIEFLGSGSTQILSPAIITDTVDSGTFSFPVTSSLQMSGGTLSSMNLEVRSTGALTYSSGSMVFCSIVNDPGGTVVFQKSSDLNDLALKNSGLFTVGSSNSAENYPLLSVTNSGTLVKVGAGTATIGGVSNKGQINVSAGTLVIPSITNTGSITLYNGAGIHLPSVQITSSSLSGTGTVISPSVSLYGSTLSPGNSPGLLSITGSLSLDSTSSSLFEIAGLDAGSDYDQVDVGGTATLNGSLHLQTLNGFVPAASDVFTIVSAGSILGIFNGLRDGSIVRLDNTFASMQIHYTPSSVYLDSYAVPEPVALGALPGVIILLNRRRRK